MGAAHDVAYGDMGMGWGRARAGWASDEVEAAEMRRVMRRKERYSLVCAAGEGSLNLPTHNSTVT